DRRHRRGRLSGADRRPSLCPRMRGRPHRARRGRPRSLTLLPDESLKRATSPRGRHWACAGCVSLLHAEPTIDRRLWNSESVTIRVREMAFRSVKPKRVLMVISVLARGGCERQMLATVSGLISRGYEIEIFTLAPVPNGEPTFEQEFAALGVASSCAFDFGDMTNLTDTTDDEHGLQRFVPILGHLNIARLGQALEQVIRRFQPEVVHCWADLASLLEDLSQPLSALGARCFRSSVFRRRRRNCREHTSTARPTGFSCATRMS